MLLSYEVHISVLSCDTKMIYWYTWKRIFLKQCVFFIVSWSLMGIEHMGQIPFWFEIYTHYGFKHWWLFNRIMMAQSLYKYRSIKHHAPQSLWQIIWPHHNVFVNNFVVHDPLYVLSEFSNVFTAMGNCTLSICHNSIGMNRQCIQLMSWPLR